MKSVKILFIGALLAAGTCSMSFAQEAKEPAKATPAATVNANAPDMAFENETHDYGTIKQGADGSCEFKFTNTGAEPLIITTAKGSCGCTVPTFPKEPIMKGQSSVIKVHYDTKRVGPFTKTVTIESNAKTNPKILTIKGVVEGSEANNDQTVPLKKTEESFTPFAK